MYNTGIIGKSTVKLVHVRQHARQMASRWRAASHRARGSTRAVCPAHARTSACALLRCAWGLALSSNSLRTGTTVPAQLFFSFTQQQQQHTRHQQQQQHTTAAKTQQPLEIKEDVGNTTVFHALRQRKSPNAQLQELITKQITLVAK